MERVDMNLKMEASMMGNGAKIRSMVLGTFILLMEIWSILENGETMSIMDGELSTPMVKKIGRNLKGNSRTVWEKAEGRCISLTEQSTMANSGATRSQEEAER